MQDLLNSTGLSKSSLYEAFGSKLGLFERCLERYREDRATLMSERLERARSGLGFIKGMLESVAAETHVPPRGCLVMNTASEFSQKDPEVARLVEEGISAFTEVFRRAVTRAQAEGDIPRDKDPGMVASFLVTNMSGLRTLAKAGMPARTLRSTVRMVIQTIRD